MLTNAYRGTRKSGDRVERCTGPARTVTPTLSMAKCDEGGMSVSTRILEEQAAEFDAELKRGQSACLACD